MVWVDRVVEQICKRFADKIAKGQSLLIRDEKTLSGPVHVGSLRGFAIHGLIDQVLMEKGVKSAYRYEFNDVDPMDALPPAHIEKFREHMGKPLYAVPSPDPGRAGNYPEYYGSEFKSVLEKLQFRAALYYLKPQYLEEKREAFNECIACALEHAEEIRTIYAEVSGGRKPTDWLPVSILCEKCGRIGTTKATTWDRGRGVVAYRCEEAMVTWAKGCGHEGEVSPFNERGCLRAKLPWKVEWAAKWKVFGVDIEGAGKDHSAAGGSRAIAARISEEVFHYPNPFDIPYEFFNIGGKKMSASKGLGATAKAISDLLPPKILRLLLIRKQPNHPIDFDPTGTTIPELFDEYDRLADHHFHRHPKPDPDYGRTFALTHINEVPDDQWHMRFSTVAFLTQMPHLTLGEEARTLKGSALNVQESQELQERAEYVAQWISTHAPEEYKFEVLQEAPSDIVLTDAQRKSLNALRDRLQTLPTWAGPAIHELIHEVKAEEGIAPRDLFVPLYQVFLGRDDGPQMGWFLSTLPKEDVISRIGAIL